MLDWTIRPANTLRINFFCCFHIRSTQWQTSSKWRRLQLRSTANRCIRWVFRPALRFRPKSFDLIRDSSVISSWPWMHAKPIYRPHFLIRISPLRWPSVVSTHVMKVKINFGDGNRIFTTPMIAVHCAITSWTFTLAIITLLVEKSDTWMGCECDSSLFGKRQTGELQK